MSGGHYQFKHFTISNLAEEMLQDLENSVNGLDDYGIDANDVEIIQGMNILTDIMREVSSQVRAFDLFMSGDSSKENLKAYFMVFPQHITNILKKDPNYDPNKLSD